MTTESRPKTATELLDEHEESLQTELNYKVAKSMLFQYGEVDPSRPDRGVVPAPSTDPKALALQGHDPRLQVMPHQPGAELRQDRSVEPRVGQRQPERVFP